MSKRLFGTATGLALTMAMGVAAIAQDAQSTTTVTTQTTKAVQNTDGTWTVIEYPAEKEVMVDLTPTTMIPGAKGTAKIMRMKDHTMINVDLTGMAGDATSYNLYAVDPMGKVTMVGPVTLKDGVATQSFTTPLDQFMLVLSPESNLTTVGADSKVVLRSAVPQGFAVMPMSSSGERDGARVGERVAATSTSGSTSAYSAPLLGIPGFRRGTDTEMKIKFAGEMTGTRANVYLEPRKDGPTTIKMRFHELKNAPGGKTYVVWAIAPDNTYHRLGQVVNTGRRNEAQLQAETPLTDFGLFVTTEDAPSTPSGTIIGTVIK